MQDSWTVLFNVLKWYLGPNNMAKHATEAERKVQNSDYDGDKKGWDWDKCISLQKEQHTMMETLNHDYHCIDDGKSSTFSKESRVSRWRQHSILFGHNQKWMANSFTTLSYLGQMVTKKGYNMQYINIAKTRSQPLVPKVAAFMGR